MTDDRYVCLTLSWKYICHVKLWYCLLDTFIIHFRTLKYLIKWINAPALDSIGESYHIRNIFKESSWIRLWWWMTRNQCIIITKISQICVITPHRYLTLGYKECAPYVFTQCGITLLLIFWVDLTHWYLQLVSQPSKYFQFKIKDQGVGYYSRVPKKCNNLKKKTTLCWEQLQSNTTPGLDTVVSGPHRTYNIH